ncbi:MAG: DUF4893 domain-containing protein [Rhodobacter sp.]|nr:DUF4893 domain-containing protein [Rhodobacter sp.]
MQWIRIAALALCLASPLGAETLLRPGDAARLDRTDTHLGAALREAFAIGAPDDIAALARAMAGTPVAPDRLRLGGDWQCNTIKAGKIAALVVYRPFRCRITRDGDGWWFAKLSGSQLTRGRIELRDGLPVYTGVGYVSGDDPPGYDALPDVLNATDSPQRTAVVGILEQTGDNAARILLPAPMLESRFDILVLRR